MKNVLQVGVIYLLLFLFQVAQAETLNITEKKIQSDIIQYRDSALKLLKKIVNINSETINTMGVHKVGNILRPQFEALGFKTHWVEMPVNMKRAGILFAERKGKKGKRILLIGHLDTVFSKKSAFKYFSQQGNLARGPGIIDAKGGDIVILYALKALHAAHVLDDATIIVALVGDEEDSGKPTSISRKALIKSAKQIDVALDFEPSLALETATVARRGVSSFLIETQGNDVHSSGIFSEMAGYGAVFELTRILNDMRTELATEKYLTFSPGIILGGTSYEFDKNSNTGSVFSKKNIVAKSAMVNSDLRFLTAEQRNNAENKIKFIVNQNLPGTSAKVTFKDGIPSMPPTAENKQLLQLYSDVSVDLGGEPVNALDPGLRGAGDISHIASIVPANLAGLGPVGWGAHSEKETLEVNTLSIATQRAALLIYRLISK